MTLYEKLKEEFPNVKDGLILGQANAIIGQFGYEVMGFDINGFKHLTKYKENDLIPIVKFMANGFTSSEQQPLFVWDYNKFKGLQFKKFIS
jgi:hypothetical protein